jgi:chloride channel protein, CIC family
VVILELIHAKNPDFGRDVFIRLKTNSSTEDSRILGWLTHRDVLAAYNARLQHGVAQATATPESKVLAQPPPQAATPITAGSSVTRLQGYRVVAVELVNDAPPIGQRVGQVTWPPSSLLIGICRHDVPLTATDDTQLEQGDRLTLLVPAEHADRVTEYLQQHPPPASYPPADLQ